MHTLRLEKKYAVWGWLFILPASLFIVCFSFVPMIQALLLSFQSGIAANLRFTGIRNYVRLFQDKIFLASVGNVFTYLIFQVPIMLLLALVLASILNSKKLAGKKFFRTLVFLPCATALVSAAIIFKALFATDGAVNYLLMALKIASSPINFMTDPTLAKIMIILVITWRWTGYNTIFYLAGMQNIDPEIYEAARIDGASAARQFFKITLPLLRPVILLTTIMSTNGTLQIFDEPKTMTNGGPGVSTQSISLYIYKLSFEYNPQFGYAAAVSYTILFMIALLAVIQLKIGDRS
ncbi:MAG: sugar ABC transporter permease [Spirochaetaceae bacterium]|jgi:lactose/L-arabinose transport system permease protein|nr:sugar ABC transporter permease [Spirochaetaceae bacterium]